MMPKIGNSDTEINTKRRLESNPKKSEVLSVLNSKLEGHREGSQET
jgi:hypothetical protein